MPHPQVRGEFFEVRAVLEREPADGQPGGQPGEAPRVLDDQRLVHVQAGRRLVAADEPGGFVGGDGLGGECGAGHGRLWGSG